MTSFRLLLIMLEINITNLACSHFIKNELIHDKINIYLSHKLAINHRANVKIYIILKIIFGFFNTKGVY